MGDRVIDFKSFSIPSSDPLIKHILLSFCKSRRGSTKLSCVSIARPYQSDIQRERVTGMLTVYQEQAELEHRPSLQLPTSLCSSSHPRKKNTDTPGRSSAPSSPAAH